MDNVSRIFTQKNSWAILAYLTRKSNNVFKTIEQQTSQIFQTRRHSQVNQTDCPF